MSDALRAIEDILGMHDDDLAARGDERRDRIDLEQLVETSLLVKDAPEPGWRPPESELC